MHCHARGGPAEFPTDSKEYCRVNAVTQRAYTEEMSEGYQLLPAETPKKVVVVGAGPAGMEAARVAALRGHQVTLLEKKDSLGGLVNTAHAFKGDHERLGDRVAYLSRQLEVAGVTVKTDTEATKGVIDAEASDAVVVATGGVRETKLAAAGDVNVVGVETLMTDTIGDCVAPFDIAMAIKAGNLTARKL